MLYGIIVIQMYNLISSNILSINLRRLARSGKLFLRLLRLELFEQQKPRVRSTVMPDAVGLYCPLRRTTYRAAFDWLSKYRLHVWRARQRVWTLFEA